MGLKGRSCATRMYKIEPHPPWYKLNLKELWTYRDLIFIFVRRDIVSMYKQTILGPLWFFLAPLFTVLTFTLVFNRIAGLSTDGLPAPLFYLTGTTLWNYFQQSFLGASGTFVSNAQLFGKVYFPRLAAPLALVVSNLFKFFIQFGMLMVFWTYYWEQGLVSPSIKMLFLPLFLVLMALLALGVGLLVSALTTKYRDLSHFLGFGVTLLMYASPVIYSMNQVPPQYQGLVNWNPLAPVLEGFRYCLTGAGQLSLSGLGFSTLIALLLLTIGAFMFNRTEKNFMDTV